MMSKNFLFFNFAIRQFQNNIRIQSNQNSYDWYFNPDPVNIFAIPTFHIPQLHNRIYKQF